MNEIGGGALAPSGAIRVPPLAYLASAACALALAAANVVFGNLNQDEGWYLYAAKLVAEGQMPYRDFAFTQGPVMPYAYSLALPLFKAGGLLAGRMLTVFLGLAGAIAFAILAGKLARPGRAGAAALATLSLASVNVYQSYFCSVVKTYSLSILLLAVSFLALDAALRRRHGAAAALSAALMVLAAGTRASAGVILPVVFIMLWLERNRLDFAGWLYFAAGGAIAAIAVFGPFLAWCPDNFRFFAVSFHALRHGGGPQEILMFKAGFASRVLQAYLVCAGAWLAAAAMGGGGNRPAHDDRAARVASFMRRALWLAAIAISLIHAGAPFPYDDYQVFAFPLFAAAVGAMLADRLPAGRGAPALLALLLLCACSAVSSPVNQDWFIEGRRLIWWNAKDQPAPLKLRETARKVRLLCGRDGPLLTQDPYLAVEAGCRLPHGMEMGQFCYFPGLEDAEARRLNVLNRKMLADLLRTCPAPAAALSGYAFAIQSPGITPVPPADREFFMGIVRERYEPVEAVTNFGQASTVLEIYRSKPSAAKGE